MKLLYPIGALVLIATSCGLGDHAGPLTKATAFVISPFVPREPSAKLFNAIDKGDAKRVDALLKAHPELLSEKYIHGETILQMARNRSNSDVVAVIQEHGAKE